MEIAFDENNNRLLAAKNENLDIQVLIGTDKLH